MTVAGTMIPHMIRMTTDIVKQDTRNKNIADFAEFIAENMGYLFNDELVFINQENLMNQHTRCLSVDFCFCIYESEFIEFKLTFTEEFFNLSRKFPMTTEDTNWKVVRNEFQRQFLEHGVDNGRPPKRRSK